MKTFSESSGGHLEAVAFDHGKGTLDLTDLQRKIDPEMAAVYIENPSYFRSGGSRPNRECGWQESVLLDDKQGPPRGLARRNIVGVAFFLTSNQGSYMTGVMWNMGGRLGWP